MVEKLNIQLQAIIPDIKNLPDQKFERALKSLEVYMKGELARELKGEFQKTVTGWRRYPSFVAEFTKPYSGARLMVWVKPYGRGKTKWSWISMGTGPREIVSGKGLMHFQVDYAPKTTPSGNYGGLGTKSGNWVHNKRVVGKVKKHKIEPRRFSVLIRKNKEAKIQRDLIQIVRKAVN